VIPARPCLTLIGAPRCSWSPRGGHPAEAAPHGAPAGRGRPGGVADLLSLKPEGGYRFSLAHELTWSMHGIPDDHAKIEEEAHRFAAAFLMPPTDIRPISQPRS
jgi:hypothetical protein